MLPELGDLKMASVMPEDIRQWIKRLHETLGAKPPTIVKCKLIVDAILSTAVNDQATFFHPGKGIKTPPVATRLQGSSQRRTTNASTPRCPRTSCGCWWRPTSSRGCAGGN